MPREASLRPGTATSLVSCNTVAQSGGPALYLWFRRDEETAGLGLYPATATNPRPLQLRRLPDYQQLDTLSREADGGLRTRRKF